MTQQPLFHDDIYEALKTIGQAYGGAKKIGPALWPDKPIGAAAQLWNDCLNRSRNEKLDPEQVLFVLKIGREIGCHAGVEFISKECNYKYETVEPESELAGLLRKFNAAAPEILNALARIEKLNQEVKK